MKVLAVFGQYNYGDPHRGEGYEYANFIPTLKRLGYKVNFFESQNRQNCVFWRATLRRGQPLH